MPLVALHSVSHPLAMPRCLLFYIVLRPSPRSTLFPYTTLFRTFNLDYPLIRFGTGDLSAVLHGASPCGRTNTRIRGWLGGADQTVKEKGLFVHPSQVTDVVKRHKENFKERLVVRSVRRFDWME